MKIKLDFLFKGFLFFLPFTQAMTVDVLFPLKLSEVFLFLLIVSLILKSIYEGKFSLNFLRKYVILWGFLFFVSISFLINIFWQYHYALKDVPSRISPVFDSLLRFFYVIINLFAFFISIWFLERKPFLLKYWVYGSLLACFYSWYLFLSSALQIPYLKLPGMEQFPQTLYGIVRCGTFKEGNFYGLYLILSAAVCFQIKRYKIGWFLLFSVITTFSTAAILSSGVFVLYYFRRNLLKKSFLKWTIISLPLFAIGIFFLVKSTFYSEYVEQKLFTPLDRVTAQNFSKVDRYITGRIAFHEGTSNPFLGVGPANYGLHYDYYNDYEKVIKNPPKGFSDFIERKGRRAIPNNVYLEVFSEYGIFAFLLFLLFLGKTVIVSSKGQKSAIASGVLALIVSFNAFPSFIMLFIWSYLAIAYVHFFEDNCCG